MLMMYINIYNSRIFVRIYVHYDTQNLRIQYQQFTQEGGNYI